MMTEEWKDVWWTNGVYQVSNYGRVYNTVTKNYLKGCRNKYNYIQVWLNYKGNGETEFWYLHRLVATVWQRPILEGEDCHHKNHLKCCNCIWNLQIKDEKEHVREHKLGNKNMLGKHHSQQSIRKMSVIHKGHECSQQTKRKISEAKKGKKGTPHTQQWKRKQSEIKKGKHRSQQTRQKIKQSWIRRRKTNNEN